MSKVLLPLCLLFSAAVAVAAASGDDDQWAVEGSDCNEGEEVLSKCARFKPDAVCFEECADCPCGVDGKITADGASCSGRCLGDPAADNKGEEEGEAARSANHDADDDVDPESDRFFWFFRGCPRFRWTLTRVQVC